MVPSGFLNFSYPFDDVLIEQLRQVVESGVTVLVATRDARLIPEMVRGWGLRVLPDLQQLEICIAECTGRQTLDNLADNGEVAVTVTVPSTYRSIQFKGRAVETSAPFPEDYEHVDRDRESFLAAVEQVGLLRPIATRIFAAEMEVSSAMIKIRLGIREIFEQTPGPRAGSRL
jgi:hypothetical protein